MPAVSRERSVPGRSGSVGKGRTLAQPAKVGCSDFAPVRRQTRARRRLLLGRAHAEVRRRYRDPDLSLADVASVIQCSPRQLQRIFREEGGEEFRAYLLRVRMERARTLLARERNPLPVRVVARRVGYRQASGLRQAFARYYGYNPSEVQPKPVEYLGTTDFSAQIDDPESPDR
jgi:AraC-like DNA-binding protein